MVQVCTCSEQRLSDLGDFPTTFDVQTHETALRSSNVMVKEGSVSWVGNDNNDTPGSVLQYDKSIKQTHSR